MVDDNGTAALVIDIGTGLIKAGWAGEDTPRTIQPTVVARVKKFRGEVTGPSGQGYDDQEFLTGTHAIRAVAEHPDDLELAFPVEHQEIVDWSAVTQTLEYLYAHEFQVDSDKHPVVIVDSPFSTPKYREKLADLFFRHFRVPSLLIYNSAVLSLFSTGTTRGIVLQSGESSSYVVPIFEGYALRHGIEKMDIGGDNLTRAMLASLDRTGMRLDVARDIKEKLGLVKNANDAVPEPSMQYELPDGQVVEVGKECRYAVGEMLFSPPSGVGLPRLLLNGIGKCDANLQTDLLGNIVIDGGNSLMKGFHERMNAEINALIGPGKPFHVTGKRKHASWVGGSMMGSLSTFDDIHITRQEFEDADDIVHKKYL